MKISAASFGLSQAARGTGQKWAAILPVDSVHNLPYHMAFMTYSYNGQNETKKLTHGKQARWDLCIAHCPYNIMAFLHPDHSMLSKRVPCGIELGIPGCLF